MQFSVTFRHMDATNALKEYARERLERINKYFPQPMAINVVMSTEKYNHIVDVNVQLHNGFVIAATETTENMYSSIDLVAAKIERQVRRYKDRLREHKAAPMPPVSVQHTILAAEPEVEPEAEAPPPEHHVIKRETYDARPMSVSDAIMQLNLVHQQFLIFRNDTDGQLNVVYRKDDGTYGLIETAPAAS